MPRKNSGLSVGFLFDDTLDSTDGVAQHVKTLGEWLSGAGHDVSYLVGETKLDSWAGGKVYSLARNVSVTFNGNKLSIPLLSRKSEMKRILAVKHFDVLHVMVPYSPFMSQRVIRLVPRSTGVVGTFHVFPSGYLSRGGARLLRYIYGRSLKRFNGMISVSRPAADFCRQSLGIESDVVPNPVDTSSYRIKKPAPAGSSKQVVFLGRLVARKGCQELIKAFAAMSDDIPEAKLIIAGDGPQRASLERLALKLGIIDKTSFLGRVSEADKPGLLASADIACFPSLYGESFGIVLVEAMAAGAKTVLGGDNPGYRSVLGQQPACLVDPRDTAAFAERLKQLLVDKALRKKIRAWLQHTVKQYDIDEVGPRVEEIYRTAIARSAKNGHNVSHE